MPLKQWTIIILVLCWLGWRLAVPVDLIRSDLGRHIKNGELILKGNWDVLYKNYYSYTNPGYPFVNHHWLFGVFCFICWHYLGFKGLSIIYLALELITFYIFFRCWQRYSSFNIACAFGLLAFPFITLRNDIRPEGISYLFCALFWLLIDLYRQQRIKPVSLMVVLTMLQIIWVNTHIFFLMGPILSAIFGWQAKIDAQEKQTKVFQQLFCLLLGACFINPSGIYGFLAPFHLDKAYSYLLTENLSIMYALKSAIFPFKPLLIYFLAAMASLISALIYLIRRDGYRKYILAASLVFLLSLAAMKAIRMIGLFGYFWIPISMYVYSQLVLGQSDRIKKNLEIGLVSFGIIVSVLVNVDWKQNHGLGIIPGANDAAQFFKEGKFKGPIFNNYSIGGYLIFHLSPEHQFFVDNRQEAYPAYFFKDTFLALQSNDETWGKLDRKYHFNAIFYSPEISDWQGGFVFRRLTDPAWALVYHDDESVIFLRCTTQNAKIFTQPLCSNYVK